MNIDLSKTKMPVPKDMKELADTYLKQLQSGRMENTGWVSLPDTWTDEALSNLQKMADAIAAKCTLFIVIGIGGSYLGAKAILDALGHSRKGRPQIRFAGYSLAGTQLRRIVTALQEQETCLCVISKSGTTMETLLAYSILKEQMFAKYGEAAKERIFVMTEPKDNPLRKDVRDFGFTAFDHPTDIGGRFSILSIVGLLPLAVAGIDIRALLQGAADIPVDRLADYACTRVQLQRSGKAVEVFTYFSTDLKSFGEWIRQLFGETEGKAGKGAYPACLCFTPDLHSIGQFLQQGNPIYLETMIQYETAPDDFTIPAEAGDLYGGLTLEQINRCAEAGVAKAHAEVAPVVVLQIERLDEYCLGQLIYFLELNAAISAMLLDVNPFDQPGVENYKREIRQLVAESRSTSFSTMG